MGPSPVGVCVIAHSEAKVKVAARDSGNAVAPAALVVRDAGEIVGDATDILTFKKECCSSPGHRAGAILAVIILMFGSIFGSAFQSCRQPRLRAARWASLARHRTLCGFR